MQTLLKVTCCLKYQKNTESNVYVAFTKSKKRMKRFNMKHETDLLKPKEILKIYLAEHKRWQLLEVKCG